MPSTPYMKLYIGDYLADTRHLTTLEHGVYLLLIMAYWQNGGPLKNDPKLLRRLTQTEPKTFQKCSKNVLEMFQVSDGYLVHKRIQKELEKRGQVSAHNRDAALKGWSERKANASEKLCERNAIPIFHIPESIEREEKKENIKKERDGTRFARPALEDVKKYCQERGNSVDSERFIDYYNSNGWKVGKNAMKDWRAAVRTWEKNEKPKPHEALCSLPIFVPDPAMKALVDREYSGGIDGIT